MYTWKSLSDHQLFEGHMFKERELKDLRKCRLCNGLTSTFLVSIDQRGMNAATRRSSAFFKVAIQFLTATVNIQLFYDFFFWWISQILVGDCKQSGKSCFRIQSMRVSVCWLVRKYLGSRERERERANSEIKQHERPAGSCSKRETKTGFPPNKPLFPSLPGLYTFQFDCRHLVGQLLDQPRRGACQGESGLDSFLSW